MASVEWVAIGLIAWLSAERPRSFVRSLASILEAGQPQRALYPPLSAPSSVLYAAALLTLIPAAWGLMGRPYDKPVAGDIGAGFKLIVFGLVIWLTSVLYVLFTEESVFRVSAYIGGLIAISGFVYYVVIKPGIWIRRKWRDR